MLNGRIYLALVLHRMDYWRELTRYVSYYLRPCIDKVMLGLVDEKGQNIVALWRLEYDRIAKPSYKV